MTLGEKLQAARKQAGLTQKELAQRLMVSRQAITKWENDNGIPDIENLKALAALFDVSVDYLVAGDEPVSGYTMRQPIDLNDYQPKRRRRAVAVQTLYPDAVSIQELLSTIKRKPWLYLMELVMPADFLRATNSVDNYAAYFLVDLGNRQLVATVTNEYVESKELNQRWDGDGVIVIDQQKYWKADRTLRSFFRI